jgi:hypothetical protein
MVAILLCTVWFNNTARAWGIGPKENAQRAAVLCNTFGITSRGSAHQRIITTDQGPFWVSRWDWADTTIVVVQEPSGELAQFRMLPSPKTVGDIGSDTRSWVEMILAELSSLVGEPVLVETYDNGCYFTAEINSEHSQAFLLSIPSDRSTLRLELTRENPPAISPERIPYPQYLLSIALTVLLLALALPSVWKPVVEARANPEGAVIWASAAGSAALLFSLWELLRATSFVSAGLGISLAFSTGAAALALAGTYIANSRPPEHRPTRSADDAILSGWLLGFVGVGLASAAYMYPAAAQSAADRFIGSGLVSFQALLVAITAAIAIELGVRPIVAAILENARKVYGDVAIAVIGAFWIPFSASLPWLWARAIVFVALLFAGYVNRQYGSWAACITSSMFFLSWFFLPGLALAGNHVAFAALVGMIGLLVVPAVLRRRVRRRSPKEEAWPPEYVKSIYSKASLDYADSLAGSLHPPCIQGFDGARAPQDEAAIFRRATPPAADICRVIRHGKSRLGILFTEVPGRGLTGAFQAVVITTAMDALTKDVKRPADLLLKLHSTICSAWVGEGGPTSIVYGVFDRRSNSFTFAGLGNHQVLLQRALVGRFERLAPSSGPFDPRAPLEVDAMLDAQSVQLISRDLLVLFTDGLVNATSPRGEKFTVERIEKLIREQKTATCKELAEALERELDSFLGGDAPADDIIVLFLRSSH